jgi:hypothetical protein
MHIRCIAHVVNLVVQALLHKLDETDNPDEEDYFTSTKDTPLHYDVEKDEDQINLEKEAFDEDRMELEEDEMVLDDEEMSLMQKSALKRVR